MHQQQINYERIASAINYIHANFRRQPSLDEIAAHIQLSPFHFQRLFTEWAGVSPKKFLQFITVGYAKSILKEQRATLFDTAFKSGLSGTSRLHDLFMQIEGMTPGEYKNGGEALQIQYQFASNQFGQMLIGTTVKGICYLAFVEDEQQALTEMRQLSPNADYQEMSSVFQKEALLYFSQHWESLDQIKFHLKATPFQLKVWEALLKIPEGKLVTYGTIAQQINLPKASRAVGTAIGSNIIAYLIPCHRVIQSSGIIGDYRWGSIRKTALIGWEAAQVQKDQF